MRGSISAGGLPFDGGGLSGGAGRGSFCLSSGGGGASIRLAPTSIIGMPAAFAFRLRASLIFLLAIARCAPSAHAPAMKIVRGATSTVGGKISSQASTAMFTNSLSAGSKIGVMSASLRLSAQTDRMPQE